LGDTCRPKVPSPTWRSFLHNHLTDIAAIDMFVVAKPRTGKRNQIPVTAKSILFSSLRVSDVHYMFYIFVKGIFWRKCEVPRRLLGRPSHRPEDSVREDSLVAGVLPN
jgi:hypothetical protein